MLDRLDAYRDECKNKNIKTELPTEGLGLNLLDTKADNENPVSDLIFIEDFISVAKEVQIGLLSIDKNNEILKKIIQD